MPLTSRKYVPAFAQCIRIVFGYRTEKKMVRIDTITNVARVTDDQPVRYFAFKSQVRKPMRADITTTDLDVPVAVRIRAP